MNSNLYGLIRLTMIILAILAFVVMCITDESRYYPVHDDPCLEPAEIETL